jgi:hypothetical protein
VNVCYICSADGVLQAGAVWYCLNHLNEGLTDVLRQINLLQGIGNSDDVIEDICHEALDELGYEWPDDEEEEEEA